ncbi:hypothetical protein GCM10010423_46430 [Streptomyces levis]|uniref:Uncharacterized protein n=1 Tax=Streptomyces levis TaxID=285566 RepID=A0ABN3NX53_9ACTN
MRRPVPEPSGTRAGADAVGLGCADTELLGLAELAVGCGPWSACTARTVTAAIAPTVSPVVQAHEGSRAGTGTHLLSHGTPHSTGVPIIVLRARRSSTASGPRDHGPPAVLRTGTGPVPAPRAV